MESICAWRDSIADCRPMHRKVDVIASKSGIRFAPFPLLIGGNVAMPPQPVQHVPATGGNVVAHPPPAQLASGSNSGNLQVP